MSYNESNTVRTNTVYDRNGSAYKQNVTMDNTGKVLSTEYFDSNGKKVDWNSIMNNSTPAETNTTSTNKGNDLGNALNGNQNQGYNTGFGFGNIDMGQVAGLSTGLFAGTFASGMLPFGLGKILMPVMGMNFFSALANLFNNNTGTGFNFGGNGFSMQMPDPNLFLASALINPPATTTSTTDTTDSTAAAKVEEANEADKTDEVKTDEVKEETDATKKTIEEKMKQQTEHVAQYNTGHTFYVNEQLKAKKALNPDYLKDLSYEQQLAAERKIYADNNGFNLDANGQIKEILLVGRTLKLEGLNLEEGKKPDWEKQDKAGAIAEYNSRHGGGTAAGTPSGGGGSDNTDLSGGNDSSSTKKGTKKGIPPLQAQINHHTGGTESRTDGIWQYRTPNGTIFYADKNGKLTHATDAEGNNRVDYRELPKNLMTLQEAMDEEWDFKSNDEKITFTLPSSSELTFDKSTGKLLTRVESVINNRGGTFIKTTTYKDGYITIQRKSSN